MILDNADSGGAADLPEITNSLRFDGVAAKLTRTPASAGNGQLWTVSTWVKRSKFGITQSLMTGGTTGTLIWFGFDGSDHFVVGFPGVALNSSTSFFRDPSAWYHIVLVCDTSQAVAGDRLKLYVNGVRDTTFAQTVMGLNGTTAMNSATAHSISYDQWNAYYSSAYQAYVCQIDGTAKTPSDFAYTDPNGQWRSLSKAELTTLASAGGTNSFFLPFDNGSSTTTLGYDAAGAVSTSTICTGGTASASSEYSAAYAASKAFDGVLAGNTNAWTAGVTGNGGFLKYQLPSAKVVKGYAINGRTSSGNLASAPTSWTLQGSNDNTNWTTLDTRSGVNWIASTSTETRTFYVSNTTAYLYYRLYDLVISNTSYYVEIGEFDIRESGPSGFNNWTLTNMVRDGSVNDCWSYDTPTNNFATLNPLRSGTVPSNGALTHETGTQYLMDATYLMASGKWYWEVVYSAPVSVYPICGIHSGADFAVAKYAGQDSNGYGLCSDGNIYYNAASVALYSSVGTNGVAMFAYDAATGKFWAGANGTWFNSGNPVAGTGQVATAAWYASGSYPSVTAYSSSKAYANFGQRPVSGGVDDRAASGGYFRYTPPSGFKALCTKNLSATGSVITSGTFTGNAAADGPYVWLNGTPTTMTIDGNAVTWGTHADKLANGFKIRTASGPYNDAASNSYTVTVNDGIFKFNNAEKNP